MAKLTLTNITSGYNLPTKYNANNTAIVNALENTLSRDGTSPNTMGANFDMNSYKIINLPVAASATEPVRYDQALSLISGASLGDFYVPGHLGVGTSSVLGTKVSVLNTSATSTTPFSNIVASLRSNASNAAVTVQFSDNTSYAGLLSYQGNGFYFQPIGGGNTEFSILTDYVQVRGGVNLVNTNAVPPTAGIYHGLNYIQIRGGTSGTTINNAANSAVIAQFNDGGSGSIATNWGVGSGIHGLTTTNEIYYAASSTSFAAGGNIVLYPQSHATKAGYTEFRVDGTVAMYIDSAQVVRANLDMAVARSLYVNNAAGMVGGIQLGRRDTGATAYTIYSQAGELGFYGSAGDNLKLYSTGAVVGVGVSTPTGGHALTVQTAADTRFDVTTGTAGHAAVRIISNNSTYGSIDAMDITYAATRGLWLNPNGGYVQMGPTGSSMLVSNGNVLIEGPTSTNVLAIRSNAPGDALRLQPNAATAGFSIAAVDYTLSAAYRPLNISASTIELTAGGLIGLTIQATGRPWIGQATGTVMLGHGTSGLIYSYYNNEIVAGSDATGFYYGVGNGANPAIPIHIGSVGATEHNYNAAAGATYTWKLNSTDRLKLRTSDVTSYQPIAVDKAAITPASYQTYHNFYQVSGVGYGGVGVTTGGMFIQSFGGTPLTLNGQGNTVQIAHNLTVNLGGGATGNAVHVQGSSNTWATYLQSLGSGGNSYGLLIDAGSTTGDHAVRIRDYTGATDFLEIDGTGVLKPRKLVDISGATAGQIKFPAAQNASADANTLDDYEEGTWTPNVGGTATYTTQLGHYTKIGNVVHYWARLVINTIGTGSTNTVAMTGLPTPKNSHPYAGTVAYFSALASTAYHVSCHANATGFINFYKQAALDTGSDNAATLWGNNTEMIFAGSYPV